jgi:glucosamine-6-phosphate deaminase
MQITICDNATELGVKASKLAAARLNEAIFKNGEARLVVSTGSSQFETLQSLTKEKIDWPCVEVFHLDEYIGLPVTHPASFRKYLLERFINLVTLKRFHSVDVEGNIEEKMADLTGRIREKPIDLGLIGIGVNGHIAFNDPPADFSTRESYLIVTLDEQCRTQQVNEGWFGSLNDVPEKAISMTPWQILQCKTIISCVPHKVKSLAVRNTLINNVTEVIPATILKTHHDFNLFLDNNSASDLIPLN